MKRRRKAKATKERVVHRKRFVYLLAYSSTLRGKVPVVLIIIGIPSPTHSFTLGLNPSFSANPSYRSLSFFSFRIHYMDFRDRLLLLLNISVFLLFSSFSCFYTFLVVGSVR